MRTEPTRPEPTIVGINRTQDGAVAVARGPSTVFTLQKERLTRRKHHWGRLGDLPTLYMPVMAALHDPIDLVVECFSSDDEVKHIDAYHDEVRETLRFRGEPRIVTISHHLSHLYSAFPPSPFDTAAAMIIDGQGSPVRDFTEACGMGDDIPPDMLEVSSFYRCERGRQPECIAKQLWDGDWDHPTGLGCFYYLLTRVMFTGEGSEGKVMGLAPFGRPDRFGLPELVVNGHEVAIPREWLEIFAQRERFSHFLNGQSLDGPGSFEDAADLAAEGQRAFEAALLRVTAWLHEQTGMDDVVFAGGTALNCSANGRILRESAFREVFIPPSAHDGGTALGCALYGLIECLGEASGFRWTDDFLGPCPDPGLLDEAVRAAEADRSLVVERPEDLAGRAAELLAAGHVVAVHQGRSESGPRALGNRSILGDARNPAMRDFINFRVKGREWFRPLAPLVLAHRTSEIFDIDRPVLFMQLAIDVRPEHREPLPAITHVDGTARIQTVGPRTTPFLHALLSAFETRTGCPVLVNTSLNGKGDPLTESPADSLAVLTGTQMHALVLGPYLVVKRDAAPVPAERTP
jgi:carbamoyltransferase